MNGQKLYWSYEAIRNLELALIAATGKSREYIDKAIECLARFKKKEASEHLKLALIGSEGKAREHIEQALECLEKYEKEGKK